jgi:DNA-binding response OmpR family regulator
MGEAARPLVLVVDDDEDHVTMLEVALESSGYAVVTAFSFAEARSVLASRDVDALVADLTLGDGSSLDLIAESGARRPRVAVILSGLDAPDDLDQTRRAGYDAHLVKPTSIEQLDAVLTEGLQRRRSGVRLAHAASSTPKNKRDAG